MGDNTKFKLNTLSYFLSAVACVSTGYALGFTLEKGRGNKFV